MTGARRQHPTVVSTAGRVAPQQGKLCRGARVESASPLLMRRSSINVASYCGFELRDVPKKY